MQKEIEDLKKNINSDSVEQALREVKEYSARSSDINVDTLQIKLMHLDEVARRSTHKDRELYSMVLQRFLCNKQHTKIGFLISSLLSSAAESKLIDKEQKFLKLHGKETKKTDVDEKEKKQVLDSEYQGGPYMMPFPPHPFYGFPPRVGTPFSFRPGGSFRRGQGRGRPRMTYGNEGCFKCGDPSHFQIACPKK